MTSIFQIPEGKIKGLEKDVERLNIIMVGIVLVLFVAFLGILITVYGMIQQYTGAQTASYQSLIEKINDLPKPQASSCPPVVVYVTSTKP